MVDPIRTPDADTGSTNARPVTAAPFDAAAWLTAFRAADGYWIINDGLSHFGWYLEGQEEQARELWREVEHSPERRAAVRAVLSAPSEREA